MSIWYAVQRNADDTDWGTGSEDFAAAVETAKRYGNDGRVIAVKMENDPIAVAEYLPGVDY